MIARRKDRLKVEVRKNQLPAFAGLGEEVAVRVEHPAAAPEADAVLLAGEVGHRPPHALDYGTEIQRALPTHRIWETAAEHPARRGAPQPQHSPPLLPPTTYHPRVPPP